MRIKTVYTINPKSKVLELYISVLSGNLSLLTLNTHLFST